jgi:hypothetical protein
MTALKGTFRMLKRPRGMVLSLLLGLVGGLTACDQGLTPDQLTGPAKSVTYDWDVVPVVTEVTIHGNTVIAEVGPEGGRIANDDHWLSVPANAVSEPTEFTFKVVGGNNIKVDFSARKVATGERVSQFPVALTLGLTYKLAKNVNDPMKLYVAYVLEGELAGARERLPSTVWTDLLLVTAPIWHFSEYELAVD